MRTEHKTAQLMTQLIRETVKDNVKWEVKEPPGSLIDETDRSIPLYLQTAYKGKLLGIYDCRYRDFYEEDEYYWSKSVGFCVVDEEGRVIWESNEYSAALGDLFNKARKQASGIDDILDDLLS